jgi:hypothetical protein
MKTINKNNTDFDNQNPFSMEANAKYDPVLEARYSRLLLCLDYLRSEGIVTSEEWYATILSLRKKLGLPIGIFNVKN